MDLLDGIEDYSSTQFQKQDVLEATQPQEQPEGENDEQPTQNLLGFDFGALSKVLQGNDEEEEEEEGDAPNLSILDRVSKRLNGGGNDDAAEVEDTQKIDDAPVKTRFQLLPQLEVDETEYGTQVVAPTQRIAATQVIDKTQVIEKPRVIDQTQVIAKPHIAQTQVISKPQLYQTQVIPKPTTTIDNLFVSEDESEEEPVNAPLSKEEREARIAQLVEQKRLERLAKEREELEQDITKGTITDEEEDLNQEANDSVISSHVVKDGLSTKELEKAQEFLNIQKRHVDIRPEFEKKVVFTKDRLLSAFSGEEEEEEDTPKVSERPPSSPTVEEILRSSPFTSPVKEQEESIVDLFQKPASKPKNPLELYAEKLKQQLSSSPSATNGNGKNLINLDSDSDIDIISSSPTKHRSTNINTHQSKFSNRAKELDKIPELTKEQRLMIKQKFSKKKYQNSKNNMSSNPQQHQKENDFFKKLHKKNIDQLKSNKMNDPDHAILEELEQDEQTMTSLLEREMERVRNIRKKEKLQERAKMALLGKALGEEQSDDGDYHEDVPDSDVADSEVPDSDYESGTERDDGEEEEEEEDLGAVRVDDNFRSDDSYMFGGGEMDNEDRDHRITTTMDDDKHYQQQQQQRPSSEYDDLSFANQSTELFQNLQPRSKNEESFISTQDESSLMQINPPSFDDLPGLPTQMQVDAIATQRDDEPTQRDENPTQKDEVATQKISSRKTKDTQVILPPIKQEESEDDDEEDDDLVTPANVQRGRKQVRNNMLNIEEEDEENPEKDVQDEDESPEALQRRIKEYEMKIRKRELKLRKRRKEMERHGLKNVIEGEAEESEDEWKGLGGIDGEVSDVANSEDEKMIDNDFNIDLKNEEIRRKFMEEHKIKDQKELEKLLDDVKNHKLIKNAGISNGLDIEISDEEDGLLEAYRRQRLIEQQQRLLKNKKLLEIFKNEKSKAFFNSIKDDIEIIKIDDSDSDDGDEIQILGESKKEKSKSDTEKDEPEHEDSLEKEAPAKKTIKIDESFVKKKLSFLYSTNDDDEYERVQRMSRLQHGYVDEDDDVEDVKALKTKSILNLTSTSKAPTPVDSVTEQSSKKRTHEEAGDTDVDDDDDDDIAEFVPSFKKPSVVGSFRSFQEQQGITIKDGKHHFSGVTISKQYKVVSGSKASITFMSKNSKRQVKSLKEKKIEKTIDLSKRKNNGFFDNSGFD